MCEFCVNIPTRYGDTKESMEDLLSSNKSHLVFIKKIKNKFFLTDGFRDNCFKINYCPICGRKLD